MIRSLSVPMYFRVSLNPPMRRTQRLLQNTLNIHVLPLLLPGHPVDFTWPREVRPITWATFNIRLDVQGNVRIWDLTQDTHLIKLNTRPISGKINDLCWDSESKRIIVVGEGKERFVAL